VYYIPKLIFSYDFPIKGGDAYYIRVHIVGALKSRELTTREWTRRHEETGVDNAGVDNTGVAKHEQRRGMSRNHTEERQQLNAPVTHAPALSVDYKSKHCLTR